MAKLGGPFKGKGRFRAGVIIRAIWLFLKIGVVLFVGCPYSKSPSLWGT